MIYIPKYFGIKELTPPEMGSIIQRNGVEWAFATLFDPHLLITLDYLRGQFGVMICNDWVLGGRNTYRGFRPDGCGVGAVYSQHRFGRAADLITTTSSPDEIRGEILNNPDSARYKYIGGLELGTSWLHIDTRQRRDGIVTFRP